VEGSLLVFQSGRQLAGVGIDLVRFEQRVTSLEIWRRDGDPYPI